MNTKKELLKKICLEIVLSPVGTIFSLCDLQAFRDIPLTINNRMNSMRAQVGNFIKDNYYLLGLQICQNKNRDGSLKYTKVTHNDLREINEKIEKR